MLGLYGECVGDMYCLGELKHLLHYWNAIVAVVSQSMLAVKL